MRKHCRRYAALPLAGAIGLAVTLSACGEEVKAADGRTAMQVLTDSANALKHAKSYHISSDTQAGIKQTKVELDVVGSNAEGTFTENDRPVAITVVGDVLYARGKTYWAKVGAIPADAANFIGDRCVKITPVNDGTKQTIQAFKAYADTNVYAKGLLTPNGDPSTENVTTAGGVRAINVMDDLSTVTVDAGKDSFPLRIEQEHGDGTGHTDFSKFNQRDTIEAPTGCLDLASLNPNAPPPSASPAATAAPSASPSMNVVGPADPGPTVPAPAPTP